ncbi:Similar to hypothetical protein [Tuber melanosporum Mel28]; acc. no. XP_002836461 [Pyronema omphalodes CBS 100304]|uniref:Uncharacterized protein n=1 Tax=Pyronema omphalodes (strain CBS 100304) TaxID=1076935 RepID=U4LHA2_PYROM|nr:Similar to hypothetical protein [Tuber melanosporum Mel28]; acc. no. XP_002836461 [Pyronema omphalodes CBS 100304]
MLGLQAWILNNNKDFDLGKVSVAELSSGFYVAALAAMSWGNIKVGKLLGVSGMVDVAGLDWTGGREIPTISGMEIEEECEGVWGDRMRDGDEGVEGVGRWGWFIWVVREGLFLEVLMGRHPKQIENGVKPIPKEEQDIYLPMKGEMPETLLTHGDMDQVVLLEEAKRFAEVVGERGTWAKGLGGCGGICYEE